MKKIFQLAFPLLLAALVFPGCSDDDDAPIHIRVGVAVGGGTLDYSNPERYYRIGDDLTFQFEVTAPAGLNKIEFSIFEGIGVNQQAPVILNKYENMTESTWTYSYTVENIQKDVRYSVYAQDNNRNYNSQKVSLLLDVTRYSSPLVLYDGMKNATSKTFFNIETGRTFFLANTTDDPANMDFGFAYLENDPEMRACFVSMDEYWATGVYPMVANALNKATLFRKVSGVTGNINDLVREPSELKTYYDGAAVYPANGRFSEGKLANNLETGDVVSFLTHYGCYGLLQVTGITRKNEGTDNSQDIRFRLIVENRYAK